MIITGGDANKYSRNSVAYQHFLAVMTNIKYYIQEGRTTYRRPIHSLDESQVSQLAEWLREKNYDISRDGDALIVDWSNK